MCSFLLSVDGESTAVVKKSIKSIFLLLLTLQLHQHQQRSLTAACLMWVVISVEQKPRLASGVVWSRCVLSPLSVLFYLTKGAVVAIRCCMKILGTKASSQLTGWGEVAAVACCLSSAVQLQQEWEVSACRRAAVSRHATIISLLNSVCSQICFLIH